LVTDSEILFSLNISQELNGVSGQSHCRNLVPFEKHVHQGMVVMSLNLLETQVLRNASWKLDEVEYFKWQLMTMCRVTESHIAFLTIANPQPT